MKGKQLKKLLFIPLTAIAVCAFVATLSACDEKPVSDGSLKYELNSDGTAYTVTGVEKEEESFVIPAEYEGKPVTAIGDGAFWCCTPLKNVTVPDGIASVGSNAFWGCTSLEQITLPDSVLSTGKALFSGCTAHTEINLPNGLTAICKENFYG